MSIKDHFEAKSDNYMERQEPQQAKPGWILFKIMPRLNYHYISIYYKHGTKALGKDEP
jgi:hypothetical protein